MHRLMEVGRDLEADVPGASAKSLACNHRDALLVGRDGGSSSGCKLVGDKERRVVGDGLEGLAL